MIDWVSLALNSLWVLGAAVILAALSYASYEAKRRGERLRARLNGPAFQIWLSVGLALVSLSLALIGPRWWERVLWGLLCGMSLWQLWAAWRAYAAEQRIRRSLLESAVGPARPQNGHDGAISADDSGASGAEAPVPPSFAWPHPLVVLGLFVLVLLFYIATLAPTVLWGDDAYFQRTAFQGALRADGGGHWLWLQFARMFIRLPWRDVAYRVNLLSAVAAAIAVAFTYAAARAVGLARTGALVAALSLAIAHTFWGHAVRAEVYTLFMGLMALQLWLWLSWRPERAWTALLGALLFGVTLLGHQMALLLLPALGFLLWCGRRWLRPVHWGLLLIVFVIGMVPFFVVVDHQMGDVSFWDSMRLYFTHSGEDFRHALFDFSLDSLLRDGVIWIGLLGLQFAGLAGLLGLWGWVDVGWKDRSIFWLALAVLYLTGVGFAFSYHVSDQYVFYLPSYLAFALFVGRGWQAATEAWSWFERKAIVGAVIGGLILIPILTYWGTPYLLNKMDLNPMDVRELPGRDPNRFFLWPAKNGYWGAASYGRSVLETLPPDSVLLADYTPMEPVRYFQAVEGMRPDIRTRYIGASADLTRVLESYASAPAVFLADDNPAYYNLRSLEGFASLRREGVIYRVVRQP